MEKEKKKIANQMIPHAEKPEEAGISSGAILRFLKELEEREIPMHSVLLMHDGMLAWEGYYAPCRKGELHRMFSVSKTLTALAVGVVVKEGIVSPDDRIAEHFPEYVTEQTHPWIKQMTIRDMLMMRSCHSQTTYKGYDGNWVESFFQVKPDHKPGTVFHYDTSSAHTLCALVEKKTGMSMLDYLKREVLREIGFSEESYILKDPYGTSMGGTGLMATSEDLLRLGMLLMQKGAWNGKQLLPESYMVRAVSRLSATAVKGPIPEECLGYGYQIWTGRDDSFVCYGMGGQLVICLPEDKLICVTTADTQGYQGANQFIYNALYRYIVPELRGQNTEKCKDSRARCDLLEYTRTLCIKPLCRAGFAEHLCVDGGSTVCGGMPSGISENKSGQSFCFEENRQGFGEMELVRRADGTGALRYTLRGEDCCIPFGFEKVVQSRFPGYGLNCAASGLWLDAQTFYIKVHILDTSCCSVHFQLCFGEKDLTVFMKENDEMILKEYCGHLYGRMLSFDQKGPLS